MRKKNGQFLPPNGMSWSTQKLCFLIFPFFSLQKSLINIQTDLLAKGARAQNSVFFRVVTMIPVWLALQANLFDLELINH